MQKLNRFVTYIYSYRDSQRDTNVGFAKVDCRGGIVRLEIQIRKKIKETKEAQICLLAGTPTQPEAIPIGVMKFEKETGIYKGRFSASELGGSTYTFEQVTGLYIKGERELFASQWTQEEDPHSGGQSINNRRETGRKNFTGETFTGRRNAKRANAAKRNTKRADAARRNSKNNAGRTVPRDRFSGKASTATRSAGRISTEATDNRSTTGDITDRVIAETTKTGKTKERTAGKPDTAGDRGRTAV